jgi:hypothetical protein
MYTRKIIIAFAFVLLAALVNQPLSSAQAFPFQENQNFNVFMPLTMRGQAGIHGTVTLNGSPAADILLALRFYDGSSWSTAATTSTGQGGEYIFEGVAGLVEGQEYYVLYRNEGGISGHLWIWVSSVLTSYAEDGSVLIGNFDIGDVVLVSPLDEEVVDLPHTFRWQPRPATPGDSYEFNLLDPEDESLFFYTDPPLGYVGSYTLDNLPPDFQAGVEYVWEVWVYSPDGGFGVSFENRWISFTPGPQ